MEAEIASQVLQHANPQNVEVSFQTLFNIAIALLVSMGGFIVNRLFNKLDELVKQDKELSKEINQLSISLPTTYVMKEDLRRLSDALFTKLDTIEAKLDKKEDKSHTG